MSFVRRWGKQSNRSKSHFNMYFENTSFIRNKYFYGNSRN